MRYARLGRTNIEVSVVCFGTQALAPSRTYGDSPDDETSVSAVRAALDTGINFFDTAEAYGDGYAEQVLGRALEGRRDRTVVATKVSEDRLTAEDLVRACEASLGRLRTDHIDLYQVHWPSRSIPFADTAEALERLKEQGKVRAWGVSNFGKADLADALQAQRPESNQLPYSLLWRAVEHDLVPACTKDDVSVICYSPLAQGLLTGKFATSADIPPPRRRPRYCADDVIELSFRALDELRAISREISEPMADVALAWLLAQPGVTSAVAGARTPEQAVENARAGKLQLPAGVIDRLTRASQPLKDALDADPDMWQSGAESRYR